MKFLHQSRPIGDTDLRVATLGIGMAAAGNLFAAVDDKTVSAMLTRADALGLRWIDTAPLYGHGLSEQRLGAHLRTAPPLPRVISTKVGRVLVADPEAVPPPHFVDPLPYRPEFDYSAGGIRQSLAGSLERLGLDRVDLSLLHDVDRSSHVNGHRALVGQLVTEAIPTMQALKREGRVGAVGLGINQWDIGYELLMAHPLDAVLLAGRYTLLDQSALTSGFLDACARRGTSVLLGGVFNSGLLAGGDNFDYAPASEALRTRVADLRRICCDHEVELPAAALQFAAAHPAVTALTIGTRSAEELDQITGWVSAPLPDELWRDLKAAGHIPEDSPVCGD